MYGEKPYTVYVSEFLLTKLGIQEKESYRWVSAYQDACALAQQVPDKQVVSISDRECDFYEFMELAQGNVDSGQAYADWLIRGKWDRLVI